MRLAGVPILATAILFLAMNGADASPVPTVTVDPGYGPPLTIVKVTGHAFCVTCGPVTISVSSLTVDRATVQRNGAFTKLIRIPGSARPGLATIGAAQDGGRPALATFTVTIDQPAPTTYSAPSSIPPPGNLPTSTGSPASRTPTRSRGPTSRPPSTAPATTTTASAGSPTESPTSGAVTRHSDGDSIWPVALAVAGAVVAAAGAGWLLRRRLSRR